ncbi:uncharacterized protein LOC114575040 [Exaiptasia diaphana]|nr:uncharacterized protein LOC114575040 [Exaiptasia diaphana]KXJ26767.1 hypothetical protein AC249_AIPGENE26396 [Exaiptasia diaphana]
MVSKNIFLSEEEGKYFKEQDMKDIMEWKTQNALISPSSQDFDSPNSGPMSPCSEKTLFHPVQVAPFPTCEVPSQASTSTTPSSLTNELPQDCPLTLPNKKERSSCLVNDNPPPFKDIPDIDTDTMLRVIKDLQNSLIDSSKTPPQYPPDMDMITGPAMDDMEQHLLENGLPLLDMPPNSSLHLTKNFCSEPASIHEIHQGFQHQVPESIFRYTDNIMNGFPVIAPQSCVDMQQLSERTPIARNMRTENVRQPSDNKRLNMDENSLADFVPLPLVEIENILSNDEHACSVTSNSASLNFAEPMDMSPRCQYTNYFNVNQMDQFYGGSAVQVSRPENELVAISMDCNTDFPGHVALDDRVHPAR